MARPNSWSDVRGGLIAALALAGLAFVVLKYLRVGRLRGETITLHARVGAARGILVGSQVWLSGQKVGKVTDIRFLPPAASDTLSRLDLTFEVLDEHGQHIHSDAVAQIRPGGSFIGQPVVYLSPGTPKARPIREGDTISTSAQADVESAASQFGAAAKEFPIIISNVKVLAAQLRGTEGTAGAFLNTPGGMMGGQVGQVRERFSSLASSLDGNRGTAGRVMNGDLPVRVRRVMARADSVRALLNAPGTSLGRLRKDSTLLAEVADIRNELTLVRMQLSESRGTAGRVLHDSALFSAVGEAQRQMALLFADIKKHPLRYIVF
jgi:phospholipid/cholesterol/gamma-HCH transport system substrate-binding protein